MRTVARWFASRTSSARPGSSRPQQAINTDSETGDDEAVFRDESGPQTSNRQESTVHPGTRLEAGVAQLQTSSCPIVGQLSHERQATLPTISEEGNPNDRQSTPQDLQSPSPVGKQTTRSVEVTSKGSNPEKGQPNLPSKGLLRKHKILAEKTAKAAERTQGRQTDQLNVMAALLQPRTEDTASLSKDPADHTVAAGPPALSAKNAPPQQGSASVPAAELNKGDVPAKLEITGRVKSTPKGNGKSQAKGSKGSMAKKAPAPPPPKPKPVPAKAAPRLGRKKGTLAGKVLGYRDIQEEDALIAAEQAATPAPPPPNPDDEGLQELIHYSWYTLHSMPAPSAHAARTTHAGHRAEELRTRQSPFAAAQSAAREAFEAAIGLHPAEACVTNNSNNILGALDSPNRQLAFLMPRQKEKEAGRSKEVWKLDLHTSEVMRHGVKKTMTAIQAADAMGFWVEVLRDHLRTQLTPDCTIFYVFWIKDGWVTVVTGKGRGCNHAECQACLAILQEVHHVIQYYSSHDGGAIHVQLQAPPKSRGF